MKNILVSALFAMLVGSISCNITNSATSPPPLSYFIIHASPDAPNIDVYDNGNPVVSNMPYSNDTGYIPQLPGPHEFKIATAGASSFLIDAITSLDANKFYSIFIIDSLKKIKAEIVQDNFTDTISKYAQLRFFQLSPNIPTFNAEFTTRKDTVVYFNRRFNDQSTSDQFIAFSLVNAGTYKLKIITSDSAAATIDSFPGISLTAGKAYTVYLRGFYNESGVKALDTGIIRHLN